MKTSRHHRAVLGVAAILTASALALSGCTNDPEPEEPTPEAPTAEAPEVGGDGGSDTSDAGGEGEATEEQAPPPEALDVEDQALQETAEKYITVRENQASYHHEKPGDWLDEVKEYMTPEGYQTLTEGVGSAEPGGGYAWTVSHEQGLAVNPEVGECVELTQASEGTSDTEKTVSCPLTDIVVDKDGKNIPTNEIPPTWPYVGEQQDVLLSMKKDGEGWKVDMDMTGMAN